MADLRRDAFAKLQRLPIAYYDRNPSGRLVTRLTSDIENIGELFGAGVISALGDLFTLAFIVAAMLWLDPSLSLTAFAVLPLLVLTGYLFRNGMRRAMRQVRALVAGLNAFVAERIAGIGEVRLFGQEERTAAEFETLQQVYGAATLKVINWDATLYAVVETLGSLALAAILWHGGYKVLAGAATFGTLVAFLEYVQKFFSPLRDLSSKYSVVQASNASLERIFELLDQAEEADVPQPAALPQDGGIELRDLSFSYDGETAVLQQIDLAIAPGETLALVGDTGSGKTTLARLLLAFYPPQSGTIRLGGVDYRELGPKLVRRGVGYVGQEPFLFAGTIRANLDPQGTLGAERLQQLLHACQADVVVERCGGLDAELAERGRNLSSGERQLLCLVRALASGERLLILDEATSRVDPLVEAAIGRALAVAAQGRAVLLIAHRLATAARADRIVVLRRGTVRESGTHAQLLAADGLYARLWRLQQLDFAGTQGTV
jgi:ATP-binding cassette subfamily B protein